MARTCGGAPSAGSCGAPIAAILVTCGRNAAADNAFLGGSTAEATACACLSALTARGLSAAAAAAAAAACVAGGVRGVAHTSSPRLLTKPTRLRSSGVRKSRSHAVSTSTCTKTIRSGFQLDSIGVHKLATGVV
jgi:hypothetical protein